MSSEPAVLGISSGTFETRLEVRWGDVDGLHHVNNTVYFRYFEEARVRLFRCTGEEDPAGRAMVLAHATCDFLRPLRYPALVAVGLRLVRMGRTSLDFECWVADPDDPQVVYARGRSVMVRIDAHTQRPIRWTDVDRRALAQGLAA